jgi:hypothetical protein
MISLEKRIDLLDRLGLYMLSNDAGWEIAKDKATQANSWFTTENIAIACNNIAEQYLQKDKLILWINNYQLPSQAKLVGIVMAGNIPLVGFHDLLCGFICGHSLLIKLSSKDEVLMTHIVDKLTEWEPGINKQIKIAERLNGCDAYIATGSNNTARYFEQYFGKYPHIIRKNRTSVALLNGDETNEELALLADDVFTHYGLGCRNITQVYIPKGYDLNKLLTAFKKYDDLVMHHKYKHNYDYYLAIYLLNKVPYLTNESVLLVENALPFSAVGVLHYCYYENKEETVNELQASHDIQTVTGKGLTAFGASQRPALNDYADGIDTMVFLCSL